jgi:iron complex outermembrane receptor protein
MTVKKLTLFCVLLMCQVIFAQQDSIVSLREVIVSDFQLQQYSNSLSVQKLNDTIIERNQSSLTGLLQYNSVIYFKQNGLGMVSSPSFRGTTAQQTAVIWNGININSQLNGQTDFNTITTRDFENVTLRAGGGSAMYGSSAIGGSVHLNNELTFKNQFNTTLATNYGSFNTLDLNGKTSFSNEKYAVNLSVSRNSSENDYEYLGTNGKKNENGQFNNTSMNASVGYRFGTRNMVKFYSQFFDSERHFSGTIASTSKSKYHDFNSRNLVDWIYTNDKLRSSLKFAFLSEQYQYFANYLLEDFETSKAETFIGKYNINYRFTSKLDLEAVFDFNQTKGIGTSIGSNVRTIGSASVLMKYALAKQLLLESSIRQETTTAYQSPLLYAFGLQAPLSKCYQIKLNHSRNFRIPTFNDLYWLVGGNPELRPEQSSQTELGQELHLKGLRFVATVYHNAIENLIQWKPTDGIWTPENIGKVKSYGTEFLVEAKKVLGAHQFGLSSTYAYTVSTNQDLDTQLTFVPFHKFNANFGYSFNRWRFNYQYLFNGAVYTLNDNHTKLKDYVVSNLGLHFAFGKNRCNSFGLQSLNCWNENYQSVPGRPLPGRNFQANLILKF